MTLYVIGNGFDIYHDVPSGYNDYAQWLSDTCNETLDEIYDTFGDCDENWWYKFEENLASAEAVNIAYSIAQEHAPNFASDEFRDRDWYEAEYAVEIHLEEVYAHIKESFSEWVTQLDLSGCEATLPLEKENALYINFNYTDTLETVYEIDASKIHHIHGRASNGDNLILGHGSTVEEIENANPEPDGDSEYWEQRAYGAAISEIAKKRKDVDGIIASNQAFFDTLSVIDKVVTLGFSYSAIDEKYMAEICNKVDLETIEWIANAYSEDDRKREESFFSRYGVKNYTIIDSLDELPE